MYNCLAPIYMIKDSVMSWLEDKIEIVRTMLKGKRGFVTSYDVFLFKNEQN